MRALTFLAGLALLPPAATANELTRVMELALQNDAQLAAADRARDAALQAKPIARGALLPQLNASGSFGRAEVTSQVTQQGTLPDSEESSSSYRADLTQTIFSREQWVRLSQADDRVALAEAQFRRAQQDLALRVAERFFNVMGASDSVRFAQAEKLAVGRQLELAKRRFEVGLSAITDVQEAQARFDLTVAQMIEAEQALSNAVEAVAEITGSIHLDLHPLRDDMPLLGPNPDDVNEWLAAAMDGNFDVRAAELSAQIAEHEVDANWARHLPTLQASANFSHSESGGFFQQSDNLSYGVGVNIPIFAGGATQAGVRQARSTHEQRLAELEGARRLVERNTRTAYQGVIAGVARVSALKQAVLSNTTALEASEVGLEVGARTAIDVLNAQRELFRAQRDHARARYDYLLSNLRLRSAAGQLGADDLAQIDRLITRPAGGA